MRRFQFNVRAMLLLATLVAMDLGYIYYVRKTHRIQNAATAKRAEAREAAKYTRFVVDKINGEEEKDPSTTH